jgi:multiple sugar transport system ATP-binding protein
MIYVTHDQVEAMTLADKIVVLRDGKVEQVGSPLKLYHYPANRFVAGFIGSPNMNFVDVSVVGVADDGVVVELPGGARLTVPAAAPDLPSNTKLSLGIRPEHLNPGSVAVLEGEVVVVERLGGQTYLYVQISPDNVIIAAASGNDPVRVHDQARLVIEPSNCHLFRADGTALTRLVENPLVESPLVAA